METKADIRRKMLQIRSAQSIEEQQKKSVQIQQLVLGLDAYAAAEWIYLYMDYKSEVQTGYLLEESLRRGKHVALPRVCGSEMDFYEIHGMQDIEPGYKGIPEPCGEKVLMKKQALVIVPGVAFSPDRMRIGYGKGYYDRYLSRFPELITCGLAYECQICRQIPTEEHDIPLTMLVTENGCR